MSQPNSLKQAERKAFSVTMEDGLLDIQIGLMLLLLGLAARLSEVGFGVWSFLIVGVLLVFVLAIMVLVKQRISSRRIGRVKFGSERRRRIRTVYWIVTAAVVLTFAIVVGGHFIAISNSGAANQLMTVWGIVIFFAVLVLMTFIGMTYFLDQPRLLLHGFLISLVIPTYFAVQEYTDITIALPYLVVGVFTVILGGVLLARFLRTHPLPPDASSPVKVPNDSV